ncbi:MAG: UDP-N-acetylmuramoyl-L-alanyl-D-glutamate--2,6-diaminopimelate ligase [Oscillospiraceae bacterium]|nr:UDP-N-acetylmuramoyl-L-alanyl-D-glutamate--2,6-diaminopimelate ligase [Oscillospiraceae bacterium]
MILKELFKGLPYTLPEAGPLEITDIVYDSRKVTPGCLFVCLRGAAVDGHTFALQAAQQGAAAILAEEPLKVPVPVIVADNTRKALAEVSAAFFGHPAEQLQVIGLTGTKGKTTTAWMIRSILEKAGHKTGLIGTIGTVIGDQILKTNNTTPESYEMQHYLRMMVDAGCDTVVIEASSIGLKAHRTDGMTFDYGLFSNFSHDHIGGNEHKDMEEYLQCKQLLFRQCKTGIVNVDDPSWERIVEGHTCTLETYGFREGVDFQGSNAHLLRHPGYLGVGFTLTHKGQSTSVQVGIPGKFSVYNALAAIAVCSHFGVTEKDINDGLDAVKVKGRVEIVPTGGDYTLLIDYAHNALSMENILTTLREYHPNRLVVLFGAGGNRPKVRRFEMGEVCGRLADLSVITADNSRDEDVMDIIADIQVGMDKTDGASVVVPDRREAIRYCIEHAEPGDIIVLAGKGHEDYQEIKGVKYPFDEREIVAEILKEAKTKGEQPNGNDS